MKSILLLLSLLTINCKSNKQMEDKTENRIITQLEIKKNTFQLGESIPVLFSIKNNTNTSFEFCYWQTPLEKKFTANFFEITHNGNTIPYSGRMIKRKPPTKDDYINLKPNKTSTQTIKINAGYTFTKPGKYSIRFLGKTINELPDSKSVSFILSK